MKTKLYFFLGLFLSFFLMSNRAKAQEEQPFSFGADLVSRYIFRGLDFGSSPAIQPYFEYSHKGLTVGAWGSYAFIATPTGIEADLYASYTFDFGLSAGLTDYYFPFEELKFMPDSVIKPVRRGSYFDYNNHHYFELNIKQEIGNFYMAANYGFFNLDNALYFEAGYGFKWVEVFAGAGNELYSLSGKFNLVNIGAKASKEIKLTKNYAVNLSSSLILNPNAEQIHLVFALGL